jgi:tRNA modification GTPase
MSDLRSDTPVPNVDVSVSSETGDGMEDLVRLLITRSRTLLPPEGEVAINSRHRSALIDCVCHLHEAATGLDPILTSESLRQARMALDAVTGRAGVENMLDALFGRFCIGK